LARRKPDFISLAYGTNEAGDDDQPIEEYEEALRKVMARIREIAPEASCLLIGPSDRPLLNEEDGTWQSRPRTAQVVEVQRKISVEFGCAFFDTVAFMGGDMSMPSWVNADPPVALKDHIHFTRVGYQRMGEVILNLLLPPKAKSPAKKK
jgi:lysophospholipase L1-like esterase